MECDNCGGDRVANINGKCSDRFSLQLGELEIEDDYVPSDFGIGGGDYIEFELCLDCGKLQGDFPLEITELEMNDESDDDEEE